MVKNLPANAGDTGDAGSIRGSGRSTGVGNGTPLQYSCLENSMNRGAWRATSTGSRSRTPLSGRASTHQLYYCPASSLLLLITEKCKFSVFNTYLNILLLKYSVENFLAGTYFYCILNSAYCCFRPLINYSCLSSNYTIL